MKEGLLWYDDTNRDLADKVGRAARRYKQKFGVDPNVCFVHPSALGDNGKVNKVGGVRIAPWPTVLRHHFWIGRNDRTKAQRPVRNP
jgi:hypothetical protein